MYSSGEHRSTRHSADHHGNGGSLQFDRYTARRLDGNIEGSTIDMVEKVQSDFIGFWSGDGQCSGLSRVHLPIIVEHGARGHHVD